MTGRRLKIVPVAMCIVFTAQAQDYIDVIKINYNNTAKNRFQNSNTTTRIRETDVEVTLPLRINATTNLITGLIYENINCRLTTADTYQTFGSAALKLGINRIHSGKWSGTYMLLPKIASDFGRLNKSDFQLGAVALLKYTKNDHFAYKLGMYYNTELFGPWLVPLAGLYYRSTNKKIEANLTLPLLADINYSIHKNVAAGLNFSGQVRTYHLSTVLNGTDAYVARSVNELFAYLKLSVTENVVLQFRGGRSIGRRYRVYDTKEKVAVGLPLAYFGDNRQQLNEDLKDGWVYQMILLYRFFPTR